MLHAKPVRSGNRRSPITRRRVQIGGALVVSALLPFLLRAVMTPGTGGDITTLTALQGNIVAVFLAAWVRLSVETYPGVRASSLNLPVATVSHGAVMVAILMLRLPYDRLGLTGGYFLHLLWLYGSYFVAQRGAALTIAVVPFGRIGDLTRIDRVEWVRMVVPRLDSIVHCDAIVADFGGDLPPEWEAFLADAALAGRIGYQVKQLSESLTGRVEIEHISENSFGGLLPARGYFHLKEMIDFLVSVALLPLALLILPVVAIAIWIDDGGAVFFRQRRIGHRGRPITVYKFRTMRAASLEDDERDAAITLANDARITRVGAILRRLRLDELPQILNVLGGQMSWIGPRPEEHSLSAYYTGEIPFYRYRHVVKPGISGWAQVNQGHVADVEAVNRKLQYDFYYIKYFSPWLDVLIMFRTIKTILTGFGSR